MRGKINSVRLPRLELKKFNGNILMWQEFWDTGIQNPQEQGCTKCRQI